jgi:MFS family permease
MIPDHVPAAVAVRRRLRLWTVLLTSGLAFLAPSAIAPALPALQAEYAVVENAQLMSRLVLTMPMLFIALSGPFVGLVVDRYGRRNVLIVSALAYGLLGISGLVIESIHVLIASRALLGIFLAGIMTSVTALVGDYFVGEERSRVAGYQGAFMSYGTLIFVVIAGLLAEIHWRAGFALFFVAFALLPLMLLSLYEPTTGRGAGRGVVEPPPTMHQWAAIGFYCGLAFLVMVMLFMIPSQTAFFLVEIGVTDPTSAGLAIGMFNFSAGTASLVYGRVRRYLSPESIFALVFAFGGVGYVLTSRSGDLTETLIAMAIGGFSVGAFLPNANLSVITRTSMGVRGRALGALTMLLFLGQFASPFYSVPLANAASVGHAFFVSGIVMFAVSAAFAAYAIRVGWRGRPPAAG